MGSGGKKSACKMCARKSAVQTLCKPNSPRNLCKLVQRFWPAVARGWPLARPDRRREERPHCLALRLSAALVTQQRGLNARPVKQDATPAKLDEWNFASRSPVEQSAAGDRQPRQQLLLVNEIWSAANAVFRCVQVSWRRLAAIPKIFLLTVHKSALRFIWHKL